MKVKIIMKKEEILKNLVQIEIDESTDAFLIIRETLSRIGIANSKTNTLHQSVHILHSAGRYYLTHFFHLFQLDGKDCDLTVEDWIRYQKICLMVERWGLCKILNKQEFPWVRNVEVTNITVIPFSDKDKWNLHSSYQIGS